VIGSFADHDGFDGVMLGKAGLDYHFKFTYCRSHPVRPSPTPEDLVVFYLPDRAEWQTTCQAMLDAGSRRSRLSTPIGAGAVERSRKTTTTA
jgi:hypothetical protein